MNAHKKYLVMIDYGIYDGWKIHAETDEWAEAVKLRNEACSFGVNEVIIVAFCPLVVLDGRDESK